MSKFEQYLMTDIEKVRLENLKLFPEAIISVKKRTVAICTRCQHEISIDDRCLFVYTPRTVFYTPEHVTRCPHCGVPGRVTNNTLEHTTTCMSIPHLIVQVVEYVLKQRRHWLTRKPIIEDSIREYTIIKNYYYE